MEIGIARAFPVKVSNKEVSKFNPRLKAMGNEILDSMVGTKLTRNVSRYSYDTANLLR